MSKSKPQPFADDQFIIADSEDKLQKGVFTLQNKANNFGMEISPENSETMVFLRHCSVRCKIVVDNKGLRQVDNFKKFSCEIS